MSTLETVNADDIIESATRVFVTPQGKLITENFGYLFEAAANTDVTTALQTALNNNKDVIINNIYLINTSIIVQSGGSLRGASKNAVLKATETGRTGKLVTRAVYIDLDTQNNVTINNIKFQPASNMVNRTGLSNNGYSAACISMIGASYCNISDNNFDFSYGYSLGIDSCWLSGAQCLFNVVENNYCKTTGITYADDAASYNIVRGNKIINANENAMGGIGNNPTLYNIGNQVTDNYIENSGRMGIEDQQRSTGTIIARNVINGVGKHPPYSNSFIGISTVGYNSMVMSNRVSGAKKDSIEVGGRRGHKVLFNDINNDVDTVVGIIVNFTSTTTSALEALAFSTLIEGNRIYSGAKGITTFGSGTVQEITISDNTIIDPTQTGIDTDCGTKDTGSFNVTGNKIFFYVNSAVQRAGFGHFSNVATTLQKFHYLYERNVVSVVGTGVVTGFRITTDNVKCFNNSVHGNGATTYSFSSNGATTTGTKFLGNNIENCNVNQYLNFPNRSEYRENVPSTDRTGAYTTLEADQVINCTANTFTVTLMNALTVPGKEQTIINSGTGVITVAGQIISTVQQNINGAATIQLATQYKFITVKAVGANWLIIG